MKNKIVKIATIVGIIVCILIYELGICNLANFQRLSAGEGFSYNFSLARIVIYIILILGFALNIDKFNDNINEKLKLKKICMIIYSIIMILSIIAVSFLWSSTYKILSLVIAAIMGEFVILYLSSNYIKNAIILLSTFGMLCTFSTDIHHALDEKKHSMSAINISLGNFNYVEKPMYDPAFNNIIFMCDIDDFAKFYDVKYKDNLTEDWEDIKENEIYYICSMPADYNFMLYIPSAIGMSFARILGGSIADVYITGRLFNLLAYAGLVVAILKILPYKKKIFFVIYMLPFSVLLAASYSIDGLCIGFIGLFIAYCLKLNEDYTNIKLKQIFILIVLFILCLLAKNLAYSAVILFVLVMPIFKILKKNKKQLPIIIGVTAVAIIACGALMLMSFNSKMSAETGDIRGGDTSTSKQLEFLLSSPLNIVKVGFEHVQNSILNFNWLADLNHGDFFGKYYRQIFLLEMIFLIYVAITDNSQKVSRKTQIVSAITFLAVFASTSLMLYLTFTPVGQIEIAGYQTRYILPVLPILLMIFGCRKNHFEKNDVNISLITGLMLFANMICLIYKV